MFIKMLETRRGSEDVFFVGRFYRGKVYYVRDSLGRDFCRRGWAYRCEWTTPEDVARDSEQC